MMITYKASWSRVFIKSVDLKIYGISSIKSSIIIQFPKDTCAGGAVDRTSKAHINVSVGCLTLGRPMLERLVKIVNILKVT